MRAGRVIGKVVLSHSVPALEGARWLIVSPCGKAELQDLSNVRISRDPSLVVYDRLGASTGDLIGYTEGGEAARPFDKPTPVDAYNSAILDTINFSPRD